VLLTKITTSNCDKDGMDRNGKLVSRENNGKVCKIDDAFKYYPNRMDDAGERLADLLVVSPSFVTLELIRPATISHCFHRKHHTPDATVPKHLDPAEGWAMRLDVPFAEVNARGRVRTKGGYEECGLMVATTFEAGTVRLYQHKNIPSKIFLEEVDGQITALPPVPTGETLPRPHTRCPEWVVELTTDYRDGREYRTWHSQYNSDFWCAYGYEHGSDPSIFGPVRYPDGSVKDRLQVSFGFVAHYNYKQNEPNIGFKGYAYRGATVDLYFVVHITTSSLRRVCARFHTMLVYGVSKQGELLFELGYKADFGFSMGKVDNSKTEYLNDAGCGDQQSIFPGCKGGTRRECPMRRVRVAQNRAGSYEKWLGGDNFENVFNPPASESENPLSPLPMQLRGLEVDIRDPITGCVDSTCSEAFFTGKKGTRRTLAFESIRVKYDCSYDQDGDGYFITDIYGFFKRDASVTALDLQEGELLQYVKPGASVLERVPNAKRMSVKDMWTNEYSPSTPDFEGHIRSIAGALNAGVAKDCRCFNGKPKCTCYTN